MAVKMTVCWMVVVLALFLSAGSSVDALDQNQLETIVTAILGYYRINGQFSLAVNIPLDQNQKQTIETILQQVFVNDPNDNVVNNISSGQVYTGTWVVAAGVDKTNYHHAELRVLDNFNTLLNKPERKFMLFYSYLSPCDFKCTKKGHPDTIISKINVIQSWHDYAFVFSKIFKPRDSGPISEDNLKASLLRLAGSRNNQGPEIGLANIFRCDKRNNRYQCTSCSTQGQVTPQCVVDSSQLGSSGGVGGSGSYSGRGGGSDGGTGWGQVSGSNGGSGGCKGVRG